MTSIKGAGEGRKGVRSSRSTQDDTLARNRYDELERIHKDARQPIATRVGDNGFNGEVRPGPDLAYNFKESGPDDLAMKAQLASGTSGSQFTITDQDVEKQKQVLKNQSEVDYDRYVLGQYSLDMPGSVDMLKRVHPQLIDRVNSAIDDKWKILANIERAKKIAPQNEQDLMWKYAMDSGALAPYVAMYNGLNREPNTKPPALTTAFKDFYSKVKAGAGLSASSVMVKMPEQTPAFGTAPVRDQSDALAAKLGL